MTTTKYNFVPIGVSSVLLACKYVFRILMGEHCGADFLKKKSGISAKLTRG